MNQPSTHPATPLTAADQASDPTGLTGLPGTEEPALALVEDVSIDGMCGVY